MTGEIPKSWAGFFHGVFLDRDGVINRERGYVRSVGEFELLPGAAKAISSLNRRGVKVAVLTNQSGIARGYFTEAELEGIHAHMISLLKEEDAHIDHLAYAPWLNKPDLPGGVAPYLIEHEDRKPNPGMLLKACDRLHLPPSEICYVGDSYRDLEAARRAGMTFFGVRSDKATELEGSAEMADSLEELVAMLEQRNLLPLLR